MTRRLKWIVVMVVAIMIMVTGFFVVIDSKPSPKPLFKVGQTVEMRFGTDQGLVMKVGRSLGGDYIYHVKFYYKNGTEQVRKYKGIELELPRPRK